MAELISDEVIDEFTIAGPPDSIGPQFIDRYGSLITRYELSMVGIVDQQLGIDIAHSIQEAARTATATATG